MITITDRARNFLDSRYPLGDGTVRLLHIQWDRGDSNNMRTASGDNQWSHTGPRGWRLEIYGHDIAKGTDGLLLVAPGIYVDLIGIGGPKINGGEIDADGTSVVFKAHAV